MSFIKAGSISVASVLLASAATSGFAAQAAKDEGGLEEIIVTAQKREENFQKVALSAEVVTREDLEKSGASEVQDAIRLVPGVKIQNIAGTGSGRIFIRGIGTASGDEYTQVLSNGVNLNLDGVSSNNGSNLLGSMFDVERVEVLKGPQGTLYGSGALGGVVNIITARPKHEFEASLKVQAGSYDARASQAMVNIPLGDTLALRVTGNLNRRNGYVSGPSTYTFSGPMLPFLPFPAWLNSIATNYGSQLQVVQPPAGPPIGSVTVAAGDYGSVDSEEMRARALWNPSSRLSVLLSYEHTKDSGTTPTWLNPADVMAGHLVCCNLQNAPPPPATPDWYANGYYSRSSSTMSGEIAYDMGPAGTLTLIPTYNKLLDQGRSFPLNPAARKTTPTLGQTQETVELRWNSAASAKATSVAGLYYTTSKRDLASASALRAPSGNVDNDLATVEYAVYEIGRPFDTLNAFGQTTYPLSEKLRATVGGRYAKTKSSYIYQLYLSSNPCTNNVPPGTGCPAVDTVASTTGDLSSSSEHSAFTWKAGLEYDASATSMVYGHVATGFKSGGVQTPDYIIRNSNPQPFGSYKDEKSTAFELGTKNRFLGNTLQLNAAVFYTEWDNMQLSQIVCQIPGCAPFQDPTFTTFYNAGPSHQYGAEFDGLWAATDSTRLSLSLSSMKGTYGHTSYYWGAPGFQGVVDLKGHEMANAPKLAGTVGITQAFHVWGGKLSATVEGEYSSDYETTHEYYFAGHTQPSYFRNNVSLTFDAGKLQVVAFGRNLQNKTTIQSVFPFGVQGGEPRLFGGSVQVKF